jgi:hypothetical protein
LPERREAGPLGENDRQDNPFVTLGNRGRYC